MHPNHDSLTPSRPAQSKRLTPQLALIAAYPFNLLAFLFLAALDILEVARNPPVLSAVMHKLTAMLLKCSYSV